MNDPWMFAAIIFQSLVIAITGAVAFIIYRKGKVDLKQETATSITMELMRAEETILQIKSTQVVHPRMIIMPHSTWRDKGSMFMRDLDQLDSNRIETFCNACIQAENILQKMKDVVTSNVEAKINHFEKALIDLALQNWNNKPLYDQQSKEFMAIARSESEIFKPDHYSASMLGMVNVIEPITGSNTFDKLRVIAGLRDGSQGNKINLKWLFYIIAILFLSAIALLIMRR